jgi:hypothetical protein
MKTKSAQSIDEFQEYRDFMMKDFSMIEKHKVNFIKDLYFSPKYKLERVQELIDFFIIEEDYEKCEILIGLRNTLEVQMFFVDLYGQNELNRKFH